MGLARLADNRVIGVEAGQDLSGGRIEQIIEGGIRDLVEVLNELGYKTVCSCAGHIGGTLETYPWVVILIDKGSLLSLTRAIAHFNLSRGKNGCLPEARNTWSISPQIGPQTTKDYEELMVFLIPRSSNENNKKEELQRLRILGRELSKFLRKFEK